MKLKNLIPIILSTIAIIGLDYFNQLSYISFFVGTVVGAVIVMIVFILCFYEEIKK